VFRRGAASRVPLLMVSTSRRASSRSPERRAHAALRLVRPAQDVVAQALAAAAEASAVEEAAWRGALRAGRWRPVEKELCVGGQSRRPYLQCGALCRREFETRAPDMVQAAATVGDRGTSMGIRDVHHDGPGPH